MAFIICNISSFFFPNRPIDFSEISYTSSIEYSDTAGNILPMMNVSKSKSTCPLLYPKGATTSVFFRFDLSIFSLSYFIFRKNRIKFIFFSLKVVNSEKVEYNYKYEYT